MAHVALLLYDTFLTIHKEVCHVWVRRHIVTTVLCILARYSAIANRLAVILVRFRWRGQSLQVCQDIQLWSLYDSNSNTLW